MFSSFTSAGIDEALHCVCLDQEGRVCHRIRAKNGQWSNWGRLGQPGFVSVTAAAVGEELHIVCTDNHALVFHNIRHADGGWQGWAQLPEQPLLDPFNDLD
jgi:hypothetical protein